MGFSFAKSRVPIGSGIVQSSGFGRFSDPRITATLSNGALTALTVVNSAAQGWYTSAPTLTITAPSANATATATAAVGGGGVTSAGVTAGGNFYTAAPTVSASVTYSSGGSAATFSTTLTNGSVTGITIIYPGLNYTSAPTLTVGNPPAANTAVPTAVLSGLVYGVTLGGTLTGYTSVPTLVFTSGGGTGAAGHVNWNSYTGTLVDATVDNAGSGYSVAPTVTVTGGGGSATATALFAGQIASFAGLTARAYTAAPVVSFGATARPQAMVIGANDPGITRADYPIIVGPTRGSDEVLTWQYPQPSDGLNGAGFPGNGPHIVVITRTATTLTADLQFAAAWQGN